RIPYSLQYSFGFQRELPGDFILEMSYVGRQGRKLFSQADVAQVLNHRDPTSGQFMFDALNNLQAQLLTQLNNPNPTFSNQPWFENIIPGGTQTIVDFFRQETERGDTSSIIFLLQGAIPTNLSMSGQFGTNIYISNQGASTYNGMLVSLRKRFSQGLQFDFNYTWSHAIDNGSSITNTVAGGLVCDLTNLRVCRGDSDFDIRHLVNSNFIYELPFGRGQRFGSGSPGWLNQIIGGWEVSGIFTARSGVPFSTTSGTFPIGFNFNSPGALNDANVTALQPRIHDSGTTIQFFDNPDVVFDLDNPTNGVFRFPKHGEIGSRNVLRGSSFWNLDTAVMKNFKMPWSENHSLQIRWESFNVFNHHAFGLPNANIAGTTFGQITTSATAAREMQFAFRYSF
ncbi:MAG TPA: hypothetical protein VFS77_17370, partial [Pyrinomonadaceae bacterium]|nr:hypothetical protein [Pyrinomonadaceae bacterium]